MPENRIYLDFNATTPIAPEVAAAMNQALTEPFGNPSSGNWAGPPARQAVETARAQVAALLWKSCRQLTRNQLERVWPAQHAAN
jgi:cysteine sulfinate desulfinase/cysteine desulfurase-like protein